MTDTKYPQPPMRPPNLHDGPLPSSLVRVWDAPTRVFHWTIVGLIAFSWITVDHGWMKLHLGSGLALLTLLVFRIAWGFVGSTTSRFRDFVRTPPHVIDYFRALVGVNKPLYAGHNPAGGWMIVTLISIVLAQVATGLFANDGLHFTGPLALWVSQDASDRLTEFHATMFKLILLLIWMHLVAVFFYLFVKGENLIAPMFTGKKHRHHIPAKIDLRFARASFAFALLALFAVIILWLLRKGS